jgi:hypothetical protein
MPGRASRGARCPVSVDHPVVGAPLSE